MFVVVSYDVKDDKRRARIHKELKNFGQWVQYSVFECDLTKEHYLRLRHRLNGLIDEDKGDSIRFYFLCDSCSGRIERIGGERPLDEKVIFV